MRALGATRGGSRKMGRRHTGQQRSNRGSIGNGSRPDGRDGRRRAVEVDGFSLGTVVFRQDELLGSGIDRDGPRKAEALMSRHQRPRAFGRRSRARRRRTAARRCGSRTGRRPRPSNDGSRWRSEAGAHTARSRAGRRSRGSNVRRKASVRSLLGARSLRRQRSSRNGGKSGRSDHGTSGSDAAESRRASKVGRAGPARPGGHGQPSRTGGVGRGMTHGPNTPIRTRGRPVLRFSPSRSGVRPGRNRGRVDGLAKPGRGRIRGARG